MSKNVGSILYIDVKNPLMLAVYFTSMQKNVASRLYIVAQNVGSILYMSQALLRISSILSKVWWRESTLWSVKTCPADHRGRFSVFALTLIVTPPTLQNHLALASEGYLNNQCFGRRSRNAAVGGEGREKHNPEVCNGDSNSGRCRRTQT